MLAEKNSLVSTPNMSEAWYMSYHNAFGAQIATTLHKEVCPLIEQTTPAWTGDWWLPMANMPIIDLIHALSVAHTYHPKNFKGYNWKIYFMVCLIAMGPSSTLRAIMTGRAWSFTGSPTAIPSLLIAMLITSLTGGLPAPLIGLVRLLNVMSTVTSVEAGVRALNKNPDITAIASFLIGLANTGGGQIWSVLVDAWFGSGEYKWSRLNSQFPRWVFVSLAWNIVVWSKCDMTPQMYAGIEMGIFAILLIDAIMVLVRTPSSPAPSTPSKVKPDPTSSSHKKTENTPSKQKKD